MRITSRIGICLAAGLLCLGAASCMKDTTIQYNNATMGNVEGSTFVSDQGNIFNIVEHEGNSYEVLLKTERAYTLCDILSKTAGGQDNEYDVRLIETWQVLTKDILTLEQEKTEDMVKEDPISVRELWISGGYINFLIEFPSKLDSDTPHMINLIQQEVQETTEEQNSQVGQDGKTRYVFRLTHNANGETRENITDSQLITAGGFVSFPINKVIQENEARLRIEWTWFKTYGSGSSAETELRGVEGPFTKDGFEHPSKDATPKTMAIIE